MSPTSLVAAPSPPASSGPGGSERGFTFAGELGDPFDRPVEPI